MSPYSPLMDAVLSQLVLPGLLVLLSTFGAWLLTKLPGPVRAFLDSGTHKRDMELVLGAMARSAAAHVSARPPGTLANGRNLAPDVINYVTTELPNTIKKLAPSPTALATMAAAALSTAMAERALTASIAAPAAPPAVLRDGDK